MNNPFRVNRTREDWHLSDDDLLLYVDGELPTKESAKTSDHLQACWTCRTKMVRIQETISAFVGYMDDAFVPNLRRPPRGWRTFRARLRRVMAETSRLPTPSRAAAPLRSVLATWRLSPRLAAGLVLTTLVAILTIVFRVPRISADQLIQKAVAQEQRVQALPQPVVYQRLRVHRQSSTPAEDVTVNWEIWNEVGNGRFRQRAEIASAQNFSGSQQADAIRLSARQSPRLPPSKGRPHSQHLELTAVPPPLQELQRILRANQMDPKRPLCAVSYESWRKSIRRNSEVVSDTSLPNGDRAFMLSTAAQAPFAVDAIIKATLLVRAEDWHPVEQRLEVHGEGGVWDYELAETAFEVVRLSNLNPSIFADWRLPAPAATTSRPATSSSSLLPGAAESLTAEINAQYALHRLRACVSEPIEVSRDFNGHVEVRAITETPERKQQLLVALRDIPLVRANIQTVAEASLAGWATSQPPNGSVPQNEGSRALQGAIIHATGSKLPIEDQLREYFTRLREARGDSIERPSIDQQIVELSNRAVSLALAASAEAVALRQLAERYPPLQINELDPASRWLLEVMVRDHLGALRTQMDQSRALLSPIMSSLEQGDSESASAKNSPVSDLFDTAGLNWAAWAFRIFASVQHAEQLTDYLFADGKFPGGRDEAVVELLADLNRVEDEFQKFQTEVNKDFTSGARLAGMKDQTNK